MKLMADTLGFLLATLLWLSAFALWEPPAKPPPPPIILQSACVPPDAPMMCP